MVDDITMGISTNFHAAAIVYNFMICIVTMRFFKTLMHLEEESSRKIPNCAPISTGSQKYQGPPRDYASSLLAQDIVRYLHDVVQYFECRIIP
ncbi:hypothetical protein AVEN_247454-1 [Araneus ventricosus]|uniref:Uncharacterized protein n=1 Tax=Araneus ventricosus TaxID=182803 RepID=A0A4Y2P7G4_ARAVE|nr:hypothetical protein AVEN_247454-1 [Araneus ventricosus]